MKTLRPWLMILFWCFVSFLTLFPIYWLLAMAIRPTDEMRGHIALIPQSLTGMHFAQLFTSENVISYRIKRMCKTTGCTKKAELVALLAPYFKP